MELAGKTAQWFRSRWFATRGRTEPIFGSDHMAESNITILLGESKVTAEFIEVLDGIFSSQGLKPCLLATVTPLDPSGGHHIEWSNISKMLTSIEGFLIDYSGGASLPPWTGSTGESFPTYSLSVKVYIHFSREMVCDHIFMHACTGPQSCYSAVERADALTVQEIVLQLHEKFNAIDSRAIGENGEKPWFHFSKDEWRLLGNLPPAEND
jgi:hypothetical protein